MNKKVVFCNNCGKLGHLFHQCKVPITSIGIIALRVINDNYQILLQTQELKKMYQIHALDLY